MTDYQQKAVEKLSQKIESNKFSVNLLHGITGSGKTEVYLRCIEQCLYLNKRVNAVQGRVIIFPAAYTHTHRGNPPIGQTKYIGTSWGILQQ